MTCSICCESFNKSLNSKIVCPIPNCHFEACKTCVRTYLLSTTNDPHCMNCKNQWDHKFLVESLNKSYIENDYRLPLISSSILVLSSVFMNLLKN